MTGVEAK